MFILLIIAIVYCTMPWYIEGVFWIVNLFIPDTIPAIDEILMFVPFIAKVKKLISIVDFWEKYSKWIITVFILIALAIITINIL